MSSKPFKHVTFYSPVRFAVLVVMIFQAVLNLEAQEFLFQINDFKASDQTINLRGGCSVAEGKLRLTSDKPNQAGACWYKTRKIDFTDGFESEFTFLISKDVTGVAPGDGFAFVIQAQSPELTGGTGDDIGYKKIPYAVALEFDIKAFLEKSGMTREEFEVIAANALMLAEQNGGIKTYLFKEN